MHRRRRWLVPLLCFAFLPSTLFAQWGDVKFTFLHDGKQGFAGVGVRLPVVDVEHGVDPQSNQ